MPRPGPTSTAARSTRSSRIRRNAIATGVLAEACAARGVDLLVVSTNEVFDGTRLDGRGYGPDDPVTPGNPYGASKAAGRAARDRGLRGRPARRSGSPGRRGCSGRPATTSRAGSSTPRSEPRPAGEPLRVVDDEWGTPTYTADVADAIVELLAEDAVAGIHHLVNGVVATRADWARDVVARAGLDVEIVDVPASTWERPSRPPRWGVLEPTPLPSGEPMRPWPEAMADYAPALLRCAAGPRMSGDRHGRRRRPCPGVRYGTIARHGDSRGAFRELWRAGSFPDATFVQANLSTSVAGVLRGLHLHRRQDDLWVVGEGRAFVALVDVRPVLDGDGPAGRRDARARRRRLGLHPDRRRPRLPRPRAARARLPRHERVRRLRRARLRLGRPGGRGALADGRGTADGRPIISDRDAANPPLADLLVRLRHDPHLTRTAPHPPAPHSRRNRWG